MSVQFRPMPWLTAIVAIMLAILISLGVWQYQRLQWKTDLLAEVEASVTALPLTSLQDLERAIAAGEPVDFRRIELTGDVVGGEFFEYHVFKSQSGGIFWDVFLPFQAHRAQGQKKLIFVRTQTINDTQKANDDFGRLVISEIRPVYGYVREDHPMGRVEGWVKSKSSVEKNRWFKFNQNASALGRFRQLGSPSQGKYGLSPPVGARCFKGWLEPIRLPRPLIAPKKTCSARPRFSLSYLQGTWPPQS